MTSAVTRRTAATENVVGSSEATRSPTTTSRRIRWRGGVVFLAYLEMLLEHQGAGVGRAF